MTLVVELNCDGYNCCNSSFRDGVEPEDVERFGWQCDPDDSNTHYCPDCWKKIQAEMADEK